MYTRPKDRTHYEGRYDCFTVELGRRGRYHYQQFLQQFTQDLKQLNPSEDISRPGNAILVNLFYMQVLGYDLLERYENRDQSISELMERDRQLDQRIADAKLKHDPPCQHCGQLKLQCYDKIFMTRDDENNELVLFTLRCAKCKGYSLYWEDGAPYQHMSHDANNNVSITEDAPEDVTADSSQSSDPYYWNIDPDNDPDYAKDRYDFCLYDESELKRLRSMREGIEKFAELGRLLAKEEQQKAIEFVLGQIKQLQIAELMQLLAPIVEAQGYSHFNFSTPQTNRHLTVGFNCLNANPNRKAHQSVRDLKRLINDQLLFTNWRLMNDGIHCRLGLLSGRLKAIETPEELRIIAEKLYKDGKVKLPPRKSTGYPDNLDPANTEISSDGTIIHL